MENGPVSGARHQSSRARNAGRARPLRALASIPAPLRGEAPLSTPSSTSANGRATTRTTHFTELHPDTLSPSHVNTYTPPAYQRKLHHEALQHRTTPRLAPVPGPLSSPHLGRPSPPPPQPPLDAAERERRAKHARLAFAREPAFTMVGKDTRRAPLARPRGPVDNIDISILDVAKPEVKHQVYKAPAAVMEKKAAKAFAVRMDTPPSMERRLR